MNLNLFGEALLGEEAAEQRLKTYLEALQHPEIECISVKISTIYSQISPLPCEETVEILCDRLELLYREAARMRYRQRDGDEVAKFVYLDMEEYRDMRITAETFMRTLERPGLEQVRAGIALQAYLPDAYAVQRRINDWARSRVEGGGAPITVRLDKGANMEMERVDAALHGWPQAPFRTKGETDANYKRMLHEGLREKNIAAFGVMESLPQEPRRSQDRRQAIGRPVDEDLSLDGFVNEPESDPEVSEAVDFLELYRRSALFFQRLKTISALPAGVVAVIPPWNFPIAIPAGGVGAALAAGDCVILKPASDTVLVAWEVAKCFWHGGVPKEALQFIPCAGNGIGAKLAADPRVDAVILTGGTETAQRMLAARPEMHLMAEKGGKDATIVTAIADREQAIKHVIHSAFSHSGQKCSATSLLILEEEVYDDPNFRTALLDAVANLPVGSAWDRNTRVGPLIRPPSGVLERGLKELETGEHWAVMPKRMEHNPQLWSPGMKWDVKPGGFTYMTELFGPVLGVMRARDLREAIDLVNQTGYGLTSGIESLDEREQQTWSERIRAGNLYINRVTTGAVVLRQPFGGMGKSAFGPGIKAGGPNYVAQFMNFEDRNVAPLRRGTGSERDREAISDPLLADFAGRLLRDNARTTGTTQDETDRVFAAIASYQRAVEEEFGCEHDHFRLLGQDNIRRYLPVGNLRIRLHVDDRMFDLIAMVPTCTEETLMREVTEPSVATIMKDNRHFQKAKSKQGAGMPAYNSSFRAQQSSIKPCRILPFPPPWVSSKRSTVRSTSGWSTWPETWRRPAAFLYTGAKTTPTAPQLPA